VSVEFWLGRLGERYRYVAHGALKRWLKWLGSQEVPFSEMSPDELVEHQKRATGDDAYALLNLLQTYVSSRDGWTVNYKKGTMSGVRSFFLHNRAPMPQDPSYMYRSVKPPAIGRLGVADFKLLLASCNRMYRAIFLSMFQGSMGISELVFWSNYGWERTRSQLDSGVNPLRVDLPGRKKVRNIRPYYTFIGRDAVKALKDYLKVRAGGDIIFVTQSGTPVNEWALRMYWYRHMAELGLVTPKNTSGMGTEKHGIRYGMNPHELRDLFRTRWQKSGRAPEAAEFFMGHTVDPLGYNKAMNDESYARFEYMQAERWLNVLSEEPDKLSRDQVFQQEQELRREMEEQMEEKERRIRAMEKTLKFIMERVNEE